ncbi:MAG TPA: PP2C family protein-serine/threonine phosphatase [Syntrophorhabdaceae bacterium]|jgi:protein phosphatase 1L
MDIKVGISEAIGMRDNMEDHHAVHGGPDLPLFSAEVYDGHLGREAARLASEMLTPHFLNRWYEEQEKPAFDRLNEILLLREAYNAVDEYIIHEGIQGGTAAATLLLMGERFLAANAGDSRVIIGTGSGVETLTLDHKPDLPEERERIESLGGVITHLGTPRVMGFLAMTRALGDRDLKPFVTSEPRIVSGLLGRENDYAVLACDGVWDVLTPEIVIAVIREAREAQKGADAIKDRAIREGSMDNVTVLVLDLKAHTARMTRERMEVRTVLDMALPHDPEDGLM